MTIRAYARFSPRRDSNECESCKNQLAESHAWANANHHGVPVVDYFDDDVSGKSIKGRTDFLRLIDEAQRGDIVVVRNLERFARNFEDTIIYAAKLREKGVRIYSLESGFYEENHNRAQKLLSVIRAMMAEWEREDKSIATKKAMQAKSMRGELTGRFAQYGYKKIPDGTRITKRGNEVPKYKAVPVQKQLDCISVIMDKNAHGMSLQEIVDFLNEHHRDAQPENSAFTKKLLSRIISRENKRFITPLPATAPQNAT